MHSFGRWIGAVAAACVLACVPAANAAAPPLTLVGSLHEHSGYSDGWPGSRPADYYASGKGFGLDFMGGSEHSDNYMLPVTLSEECLGSALPQCLLADPVNPADSLRKWDATLEQAHAATDARFTAFRGFEWTSDRHGHISVYMSRNQTNARADGGEVAMGTFWSWFERSPELGGGSDGIATFNHPGGKKLSESDPAYNWNDFAYRPGADGRMVGIEVFNDAREYDMWYAHALDRGWHVGAIGAEDLGHRRTDDWGGPGWAKTVLLAGERSENGIRAALLERRFYAVRTPALRMSFGVDGQPMGERLRRIPGDTLKVNAGFSDPAAMLELVTSGGKVVARSGAGRLKTTRRAGTAERYYFVRAVKDGKPIAYSSPVWVELVRSGAEGTWLAGDLHVHTCFSHDAYCGPADDNTGPEEAYTLGSNVTQRFLEASLRGLDYVAITDHNDVRSSSDPGFGSAGVVGLPGYEASIRGHAQMLGAKRLYPAGDGEADAITAMADDLREDGGVFQLNHPNYKTEGKWDGLCEGPRLHWRYGTAVVPDVVEVWNAAQFQLRDSTSYWEKCWLERGYRIGATGGSDTHWSWLSLIQGAGNPTTWVLSDGRTERSVLQGIDAGRTTISRLSPTSGGAPLLLEADADGDGAYESTIGDRVPPGVKMRVRSGAGPLAGTVRVRANGETIVDKEPLAPGGVVAFRAPKERERGWVRAELWAPGTVELPDEPCEGPEGVERVCPNDFGIVALTSPLYLRGPGRVDPPGEDPSLPRDQTPAGGGEGHPPEGGGEAPGTGGGQTPGGGSPTAPAKPRVRVRATVSGRARRKIGFPVSSGSAGRATIEVLRGTKRVQLKRLSVRKGRTVIRLSGLKTGSYKVKLTLVDAAGQTATATARLIVR